MLESPVHNNQWKCIKCNTWNQNAISRCGWCGSSKPDAKVKASSITDSSGTPDKIRQEQDMLNKIRSITSRLSLAEKTQLLKYIEETFKC